jgi:hypothetical protein
MTEIIRSEDRSSGPSIALIAVIAVLVIAGLAIWFTTRNPSPEAPDTSTTTIENRAGGTTTTEPTTVEKDTDINVNVPDSVTIDAH